MTTSLSKDRIITSSGGGGGGGRVSYDFVKMDGIECLAVCYLFTPGRVGSKNI